MPSTITVSFSPDSTLEDVTVTRNGRSLAMLGGGGSQREITVAENFLATLQAEQLPVVLGAGAGYCLEVVVKHCEQHGLPLLIIDCETDILEATALQKRWDSPFITWLTSKDEQDVTRQLTQWQNTHGGRALKGCVLPFYQRLNKPFFGRFREYCEASSRINIWDKMRYARFTGETPRILFLTSKYFLTGEITAACKRLNIPFHALTISDGEIHLEGFVESLLETITSFRPDFVFTINHLGVDREGVLVDLLERINLPLASWFVDNPLLILAVYEKLVSPMTSIFTWDYDNIPSLRELGFSHVEYLSLGTDTARFTPPKASFVPRPEWVADVSFVGNSMLHKVSSRLGRLNLPRALVESLTTVGAAFDASEERSVATFLEQSFPELYTVYAGMDNTEEQLGYQAALTWEATRQYRLNCVTATFPFEPLIVGDTGWEELIPSTVRWRKHGELAYYDQLPLFYPCSAINFNCTSKQMKGAVNQRVFDVPAAGAFLLTDYREQVDRLFEPGKEIICYHSPEEAEDLIRYYLRKPHERQKIIDAAYARVVRDHSYDNRLNHLIAQMTKNYA